MIEKDLNILKDLVEANGNWKQKEAFNNVVNHCDFLDNNYKEKNRFFEKLIAWYFNYRIEISCDKWKDVSDFHIRKLILDSLSFILNSPIKIQLDRFVNNVQYIKQCNDLPFVDHKKTSDLVSKTIKQYISLETKDNNATN